MANSQIIDEKYLPLIEQALADLDKADRELELAQRAGLFKGPRGAELQQLQARVAGNRDALMSIRQVYFPPQ